MRKTRKLSNKRVISNEEWESVQKDATAARALLESSEYVFFREYLANAKQSIVDYFVHNKIKKVEEHFWSDAAKKIMKVLHITKEEQENELSGQYQFIEQLMSDLQFVAYTRPEEYKRAEKTGEITLEVNEKNESGTA